MYRKGNNLRAQQGVVTFYIFNSVINKPTVSALSLTILTEIFTPVPPVFFYTFPPVCRHVGLIIGLLLTVISFLLLGILAVIYRWDNDDEGIKVSNAEMIS